MARQYFSTRLFHRVRAAELQFSGSLFSQSIFERIQLGARFLVCVVTFLIRKLQKRFQISRYNRRNQVIKLPPQFRALDHVITVTSDCVESRPDSEDSL